MDWQDENIETVLASLEKIEPYYRDYPIQDEEQNIMCHGLRQTRTFGTGDIDPGHIWKYLRKHGTLHGVCL